MTIYFAPNAFQLSSFTLTAASSSSLLISPYSGAQTTYDFGGEYWRATGQVVPRSGAQLADLEGWLLSRNGPDVAFYMNHFDDFGPYGTIYDVPVVASSGGKGSKTMTVQHVLSAGNPLPALVRGDTFEIGHRLHRVSGAAATGVDGTQIITIWPPLRADPSVSDELNLTAPYGTWRLTADALEWSRNWSVGREQTITLVEALP